MLFRALRRSIFPSEQNAQFFRFCLLSVVLPALACVAVVEAIGWQTGTTMGLDQLADIQQRDGRIIALPTGGIPRYAAFKLARIRLEKPDIVFIGQSRCSQVRSAMFQPYKMYNACLTAWTFDQIAEMTEQVLAVSQPKIVIVEIDYFMFTEAYRAAWTQKAAMNFRISHVARIRDLVNAIRERPYQFVSDLRYLYSYKTQETTGQPLFGLDAVNASAGFRDDGSFLYPLGNRQSGAEKNKDAARDFASGIHGAPGIDVAQYAALGRLAAIAKKHNIVLVGLQLPILQPAVDFLNNDIDYRPYSGVWREFQSDKMIANMKELGIHYFDLTKSTFARDPNNFVDPAHPNEYAMAGALLELTSQKEFVDIFPKIQALQLRAALDRARELNNRFDVF